MCHAESGRGVAPEGLLLKWQDCCWNGRVNNRPVARLTRSRRASDLLQTEAWFQPENMVIKQHVARQVYRWQLAMCYKLKFELRGSRKLQDLVLCSWGSYIYVGIHIYLYTSRLTCWITSSKWYRNLQGISGNILGILQICINAYELILAIINAYYMLLTIIHGY